MRSFVDSLKKELQLTLNTQLDDLRERIDKDYVAKDMWQQHNLHEADRLNRIENRVEEVGRNVHNYNTTVMKVLLSIEAENTNERQRVEHRERLRDKS